MDTLFSPRTLQAHVLPRRMTAVRRRGNLQDATDRLDPIGILMLVDVGLYVFSLRPSPAWAKKALAVRRISLARRSSLFSRSSALNRPVSSLVALGR